MNSPTCTETQHQKQHYSFEITTTQQCNMRCTYCFENKGGFLEDKTNLNDSIPNIIRKARYMLKNEKFLEKYSGISFIFWGGEATLNMKMIDDIVKEFIHEPNITFFLYSNGLQVSSLYKFINEMSALEKNILKRFKIQFSYDGNPVHDITRLDKKGDGTAARVIKNLYRFLDMGMYVTLKSTIEHKHFNKMVDCWDDFNNIDYEVFEKYKQHIFYAPTIDENHQLDDEYFNEFKLSTVEIAKKEYKRFLDNKPFLMSWFSGKKGRCAVGSVMGCLDISGSYNVCHGANYSLNKEDLTISNISVTDESFFDSIIDSQEKIKNIFEGRDEDISCKNCSATNCPRCEIINYSKSSKETFAERWVDYNNDFNGFCRYWKFFGLVDRALNEKMKSSFKEK